MIAVLVTHMRMSALGGRGYYTYPALRVIQVLPGHPLADSKDETVSSISLSLSLSLQRRTSL